MKKEDRLKMTPVSCVRQTTSLISRDETSVNLRSLSCVDLGLLFPVHFCIFPCFRVLDKGVRDPVVGVGVS